MNEQPNWSEINAEKRRDITWNSAWKQAATLLAGQIFTVERLEQVAKDIFAREHAPYEPGGEWSNPEAIGLKKIDMKTTVNIDETQEMKEALQTQQDNW